MHQEQYTKASGKLAGSLEEEVISFQTGVFMKESGKITKWMEREDL